jgi:hypothetical protein
MTHPASLHPAATSQGRTLVNLTPHPVVLRRNGIDVTIPPNGTVCRVASTPGVLVDDTGPVPIYGSPEWGDVEGLPPPHASTVYIVSGLVAGRVDRRDVVSPGTGPADGAIRDTDGRIVAVTRLISAASVAVPLFPVK